MTSSMLASVDPGYQLTFSEAASPALTTVMHRRPWSSAVSAMAAADGLLDRWPRRRDGSSNGNLEEGSH
jgi:hypothetical protein